MKKTKMLKKNYEFRNVFNHGKYFFGQNVGAYILKNKRNENLLGLAIGTKTGKAFQRNRIKRLLRENYKLIEDNIINGYSIVFLFKKNNTDVNHINFYSIQQDMVKILKKANLIID